MGRNKISSVLILFIIILFTSTNLFAEDSKPKFGGPNMGVADRLIRTGVGAGMVTWGAILLSKKHNTGYIPLGISTIPLMTAAVGRCPLYYLFNIDTRDKKHQISLNVGPAGTGLQYAFKF